MDYYPDIQSLYRETQDKLGVPLVIQSIWTFEGRKVMARWVKRGEYNVAIGYTMDEALRTAQLMEGQYE